MTDIIRHWYGKGYEPSFQFHNHIFARVFIWFVKYDYIIKISSKIIELIFLRYRKHFYLPS